MKRMFVAVAAVALLCLCVAAQGVSIETVTVGDPGNAADTRYASPGYGAVSYTYNIGKYEVTAAQYVEFLNAKAKTDPYGLYDTSMGDTTAYQGCNIQRSGSSGGYSYSVASGWANRPVNYVSFWDACRFANWLNNGQGDGDTESGAYTLTPAGISNNTITRNTGCRWAVTSEDEWYKAAYYKGGGTSAGYWDYATQSNAAPASQVLPTDPGNSVNYYTYTSGYSVGSPYWRTNVGEFENSVSAYGTFDQSGNVYELNEAIISEAYRGLRGGSFWDNDYHSLQASNRLIFPTPGFSDLGFRVAEAVPEPSSLLALSAGGLGLLLAWRRRRGS
ncbi:MAG: SUMF1/EgtB/PvdO family nonheme iron enzyme [Armatimonadota bacterium]|nr:SUMF1/EgtB/PvdO family nonheme iron enzyme [Armatimonadota bacterium]